MPEITIKYSSSRTLKALRDFAKYFDFVISSPVKLKSREEKINGVSIILADSSIDVSDLSKIFTGKNKNAKELRNQSWLYTKGT